MFRFLQVLYLIIWVYIIFVSWSSFQSGDREQMLVGQIFAIAASLPSSLILVPILSGLEYAFDFDLTLYRFLCLQLVFCLAGFWQLYFVHNYFINRKNRKDPQQTRSDKVDMKETLVSEKTPS